MPRKIEDIRLNKDKKRISFKEEVFISAKPTAKENIIDEREIIKPIIHQEKIYQETTESPIAKEKESKIDEYLKNRLTKNTVSKRLERTPQIRENKKAVRHTILFIFLLVVVLGGMYWLGNLFEKASVSITSKSQLVNYDNKQFIASRDVSNGGVGFEIMIVPDKRSKNITLTEPKEVSENAKGKITLFNEYSTTAQNIVAGTMLSDDEGKTYKTGQTITIPGYKTASGQNIAGQVDVSIFAFLPGDVYNGSPEKFYINAFKGTAKHDKIYGKLKEPLTGGASGLVYTLDEDDKENMKKIAETSLQDEIYDKVMALVPEGYILYKGATNFSYKIPDNFYSKEAEAKVDIEGELAVVLLKKDSLIRNIIKTSLPKISEDEIKEIKISDLENFVFNFVNTDQQITKDIESIPFTLSGDANAIWYPNIELLKTKLLGVYKDDTLAIFREDPGISSAVVNIFPPWQKNLPKNINKIEITRP